MARSGNLIIDGFELPVPPQGINISGDAVLFNSSNFNMEDASLRRTGTGNLVLSVSWIVGKSDLETGDTLHEVLSQKVVPLFHVLTTYPFCVIDNDQVEGAVGYGPSLWVWRSWNLSGGGSVPPSCLSLEMTFEIFDHTPFIPSIAFRKGFWDNTAKINELTSKYRLDDEQSLVLADGITRYRDISIGEVYDTEYGCLETTTQIEQSAPFLAYIGLLLNGIPLVQSMSANKLFTLQSYTKKTFALPTDPTKVVSRSMDLKTPGLPPIAGFRSSPTLTRGQMDFLKKELDSTTQSKLEELISGNPNFGNKIAGLLYDLITRAGDFVPSLKDKKVCPAFTRSGGGYDQGNRSKNTLHTRGMAVDIHFPGIYTYQNSHVHGPCLLTDNQKDLYLLAACLAEAAGIFWGGFFYLDGDGSPFGSLGDFIHFEQMSNKGKINVSATAEFNQFKVTYFAKGNIAEVREAAIKQIPEPAGNDESELKDVLGQAEKIVEKQISSWRTERNNRLLAILAEGWEIIGESADSGTVICQRKDPEIRFGAKPSESEEALLPIVTGISISATNNIAGFQLASRSRPSRQYSGGGAVKRVSLQLAGPGDIKESGVQTLISLMRSDMEDALHNKVSRTIGGIDLINSLVNAFGINKVVMSDYEIEKSDPSITLMSINLQPIDQKRKQLRLHANDRSLLKARVEVLQRLLGRMNGILPHLVQAAFLQDTHTLHHPYLALAAEDFPLVGVPTMPRGTMSDTTIDHLQAELAIHTKIWGAITAHGKGGTIDKGPYSSVVLTQFPALKSRATAEALGYDDDILPSAQEQISKLEGLVRAYETDLAKINQGEAIPNRTAEGLSTDILNLKKNIDSIKALAQSTRSVAKESMAIMDAAASALVPGKGLNADLYKILQGVDIGSLLLVSPEYRDIMKKYSAPVGGIVSPKAVYESMRLPPSPLTGAPNGCNPAFFWSPAQVDSTMMEDASRAAKARLESLCREMELRLGTREGAAEGFGRSTLESFEDVFNRILGK